jgi:H2-forming N5,N10-methylenetetrahydromethanopterin dehydrogenase-like enzyme
LGRLGRVGRLGALQYLVIVYEIGNQKAAVSAVQFPPELGAHPAGGKSLVLNLNDLGDILRAHPT